MVCRQFWEADNKLITTIPMPHFGDLFSGKLDLTSGFLLFALIGPKRRSLYILLDQLVFLVLFTPPIRMCCGVPGRPCKSSPVLVWPDRQGFTDHGEMTCAAKSLEDRQYRCIVSIPLSMFSDGGMLKSLCRHYGFLFYLFFGASFKHDSFITDSFVRPGLVPLSLPSRRQSHL